MANNNEVDIPDVDDSKETIINDEKPNEIEPEPEKGFFGYLISLIKNNVFVVILIVVLLGYIFLFSSLGNRNRAFMRAGAFPGTGATSMANASPFGSITNTIKSGAESVKETAQEKGSSLGDSSSGKYIMEILLWAIFVLLILLNGVLYIFNVDVITSIKNLFGNVPEVELVVDTDGLKRPIPLRQKEVYHIPGNHYDYESAKAICKARDSELATYEQLNKAFEKGADWCGYGWSEGQMALFPTQTEKWEKLQEIEGHENDCGRPGINGGYIDNPNIQYGINCFGFKTPISPEEAQLMSETSLYPKTQKELDFEKKVDYWKTKIPDILLAPFNHNNWSIF
tara:strand:+ start:38 stop:1057 length:1020 start_codon:yes stop_codon:yes gene_type:complete